MSLLESPLKPQVKDFLKFLGKETIFHLSGVSTSNRVVPTSEEGKHSAREKGFIKFSLV